jgi:GDP-mannose 4,6-dehydratase
MVVLRHRNFKERRVLITGITGFVGPHLAKSLLDEGATIYGLARRRSDGNLRRGLVDLGIDKQVILIEGSVEDLTSLLTAIDRSQPDYVFHLAAQSFVERSFINPLETFQTNAAGTTNLLEALRVKDRNDTKFIFAGSSEEYGLVFSSQRQLESYIKEHGDIFPYPARIPELPVKETNPLRPMSPYAVTKVHGEYITLNYHRSYGLKTLVARAFNHEGARRGSMFVTSTIARQVVQLRYGSIDRIKIGNVNTFRDWSHVEDIVEGYKLLALKGDNGDVYNFGSERTNSVLTYLCWTLQEAGYIVQSLSAWKGNKKIDNPAERLKIRKFGMEFEGSRVDELMLGDELSFLQQDVGIKVQTSRGDVTIEFDIDRFRPADVPILLSDTRKAKENLGFYTRHALRDIILEQLNYYTAPERR